MIQQAVVEDRNERTGSGKDGKPWKAIGLKLNGTFIGGFTGPRMPDLEKVNIGDTVEFESKTNGKYENLTMVKIIAAAKVLPSGKTEAAVRKDIAITVGASMHDATRIVCDMITHGAIALPSQKNKSYDAYMGYVKQVCTELVVFAVNFELPEAEEEVDPLAPVESLDDAIPF